MIKKLHIKNFQIHKDLTLDFESGVNVLRGHSDCGKSAVVRSLVWLAFNRPAGDEYRTWGTNCTEVTVETEDHIITRKKDKSFNGYILDGQEHAAVGRDVPEPVQLALNLNEINVQRQHDIPYLIAETPGEVGKQLNSLVDLTIIDTTVAGLNRRVKDRNKTVSVLEATLLQQKAVVDQYQGLDNAARKLKKITERHGIYQGCISRAISLQAMLRESYKYADKAAGLEVVQEAIDGMEGLEQGIISCEKRKIQLSRLQRTVDRYNQYREMALIAVEDAITEADTVLAGKEQLDKAKRKADRLLEAISVYSNASDRLTLVEGAPDALRSLESICGLNRGVLGGGSKLSKLDGVVKRIMVADKRLQLAIDEEKGLQEEHTALFGGNCPLCNHSMAG